MARMIQIPVTLDSSNRKKDGSVGLKFTTTSEIQTDEFMIMDTYRQSMGWLLFRENEIKEDEVPEEDVDSDVSQSSSIQLRNALWVLYKEQGRDTADKNAWNIYYKSAMQRFKKSVLDQVRELE